MAFLERDSFIHGDVIILISTVFGAKTARIQSIFPQPPHHDIDMPMGHDHAGGACLSNSPDQPSPIGVIGQDEAAIHPSAAPGAAQKHPAARKPITIVSKPPHPGGTRD